MPRTALICLIAVTPAFLLAAAFAPPPESEPTTPCLVIWRYGGRVPNPNQGLEVAIWRDGAILLSPRGDALGQHMLVGKVDPNDLTAALRIIHETGFAGLKQGWIVPDASYTRIAVADGKAVTHGWHEVLLPGFGGELNTDADYRAFVRTWKRTRAAIESIAPVELRRLAGAKEFRGYVVDAPHKTAWRPG